MRFSMEQRLSLMAAMIFVISLCLPAYVDGPPSPHQKAVYGAEVLLVGFIGGLVGEPRWLANPIFIYVVLGCLAERRIRTPQLLGFLLLVVAVSLLVYQPRTIQWAVGAYVWGLSMVLAAFIASLLSMKAQKKNA